MSRPGNRHHYGTKYRAPDGRTEELVTAKWDVRGEAKDFLGMVVRGQTTVDRVKADILMSDVQLRYLLEKQAAPPEVLRAIQARRQWTWETFLDLYRQAFSRRVVAA